MKLVLFTIDNFRFYSDLFTVYTIVYFSFILQLVVLFISSFEYLSYH